MRFCGKVSSQEIVDKPDAGWGYHRIDVIQKRVQRFAGLHLCWDCLEGRLLGQGKQGGHERVPLFPAFCLCDCLRTYSEGWAYQTCEG